MDKPRRHSDIFSSSEIGEFTIRKRPPAVGLILTVFLISFALIMGAALYSNKIGDWLTLCVVLFGVLAPICWYSIFFAQQNRDMLMATEFQNALFSAAARLKSKFCMIVKADGTIVYHDRNFEEVFPETSNRGLLMIDKLFNARNIAQMEADKLFAALNSGRSDTVFVDIDEGGPEPTRVIITVDPLPRPKGFFIMRGRDYVAKKYEAGTTANQGHLGVVDDRNAPTMAHMLHTMPFGMYSTDTEGHLLFVNYKLESMLGYDQNEIVNKNLTLFHLIPEENTDTVQNLLLRECAGEINFMKRDKKIVTLHVQQQVTKNATGNLLGSVAIVTQGENMGSGLKMTTPSSSGSDQGDGPQQSPSLIAGKSF